MKLLEVVILANAERNKTQMVKSLPAWLLSPVKQKENKYMPVDTGEERKKHLEAMRFIENVETVTIPLL